MRGPSGEFSLHVRQTRSGRVFYAQFKLDNGKWTNAKSTRVVDRGKPRDRQDAAAWAQHYLDSGQIVTRERVTMSQYAADFFDWDGEWAKEKRLRGKRVSRRSCVNHQESVKKWILPRFGKMKLTAIDDETIRAWQRWMSDEGLAGATINRKTVALRLILKQAHREKLIRAVPYIEAVAEIQRERGVYRPEEIRAIFSAWWPDERARAANLVAAATGMRASEIVALQEKHLHVEYVDVVQSWSPQFGMGRPKTGKTRLVPIPHLVYEAMRSLLDASPFRGEERFIFPSVSPDRPMDQSTATRELYRVLEAIGIHDDDRKRRGLDFHAWRHTFNSLLVNRRVPLQLVQKVTGHLTDRMTEHYYHSSPEEMVEVRQIQEAIFARE